MLRMDTHTKQIFFSGMFAYISTVAGLIYSYSIMQENHSVRIGQLETVNIQSNSTLKNLSTNMGELRTKNASVEVMLETLNKSVIQLSRTTIELGKIAARLDERSRG